jgi:cytochrome c6
MKKGIIAITLVLGAGLLASAVSAAEPAGEALFMSKCASCHPNGGNTINPKETLKGIKSTKKIIKQIRKGGDGMPAFDAKAISDKDAKLIAGYIVKTFKK